MDVDDLVDTSEMYLKAVLELEEEGVVALRARLADRFEHAGPTVSQTVARLQRHDLIELEADRHLVLTPAGRETATSVMRKHRLAEVFLDRVVGLDWQLLHEEACRWEHVMSDRVEQLLDDLLGHPDRSPYGNPIRSGEASPERSVGSRGTAENLIRHGTVQPDWAHGTIEWIGEPLQAHPDALTRLRRHGLIPGASIAFVLHGPAVLTRVGESQHEIEIPHELAVHVFASLDEPSVDTSVS